MPPRSWCRAVGGALRILWLELKTRGREEGEGRWEGWGRAVGRGRALSQFLTGLLLDRESWGKQMKDDEVGPGGGRGWETWAGSGVILEATLT